MERHVWPQFALWPCRVERQSLTLQPPLSFAIPTLPFKGEKDMPMHQTGEESTMTRNIGKEHSKTCSSFNEMP